MEAVTGQIENVDAGSFKESDQIHRKNPSGPQRLPAPSFPQLNPHRVTLEVRRGQGIKGGFTVADHLAHGGAHDGPGTKFIRVRHLWNGTLTDHSTEILYAGGGLLLAGDATTQLAPIIQTLDTALRRGAAVLEIVTEHVAASHRLTIQRYYLYGLYGGRHRTDSAFNQEMFGHDPALLADAERTRRARHAASLRRVQHAINERQAERERAAARIAQEMKTRAFWIRRHREHLAKARGARRPRWRTGRDRDPLTPETAASAYERHRAG